MAPRSRVRASRGDGPAPTGRLGLVTEGRAPSGARGPQPGGVQAGPPRADAARRQAPPLGSAVGAEIRGLAGSTMTASPSKRNRAERTLSLL